MHKALYRKWRPSDFDSVCGQEQITDILKYQIANSKTNHAYLFCGSRGTGKTSCAKIFAKAVNCQNPVGGNPCNQCEACRSIDNGTSTDVIEMDAASNTGVDNVRDIKDEIVFSPAELKYRVYIIDEVHMMSSSAFNALLKTLEEPPAHVIFILATTELHKLPSTIISRTQRFDFKRISSGAIIGRLMQISKAEGIDLTEDGARLIARMALGGMRDAISLLELCAGMHRTIDYRLVSDTLGSGNRELAGKVARAVLQKDYNTIYGVISEIFMNSRDIRVFFGELIDFYRDLMIAKTTRDAKDYLELTDVEYAELMTLAESFTMEKLIYQSRIVETALSDMQRVGISVRATAELAMTRMCEPSLSMSQEALVARISDLEREISRIKCGLVDIPTVQKTDKIEEKTKAEETTRVESAAEQKASPASSSPVENTEATDRCELEYWLEAIGEIRSMQPSIGSCLNGSVAYSAGNKFLIGLPSAFFISMISTTSSILAIASVLSEHEGRRVSEGDIKIFAMGASAKAFDFESELKG